jgi:hypothetical protein
VLLDLGGGHRFWSGLFQGRREMDEQDGGRGGERLSCVEMFLKQEGGTEHPSFFIMYGSRICT